MIVLAVLSGIIFLGYLGAVELWGKREQRAAAESLDTVRAGHWLVAEIQCRPRLEKPPLPRWTTATLMLWTARCDEWIVRLPNAIAALVTVGLITDLGRRIGGRSVGLAAGACLTSLVFFISEMRQAGNDAPLALFTTLAIYAAWRRWHGGRLEADAALSTSDPLGARGWVVAMDLSLGLGFLCKGPVVLMIVGLAIVPYLAFTRQLRRGSRALWDAWGLVLFLLLASFWPILVSSSDPHAWAIWGLEMGQKTVAAGVGRHQAREVLLLAWFELTLPWSAIATWALFATVARRDRRQPPGVWLGWSWAVGNLAVFSLWRVAKPSYFLPCLPGVALLVGMGWVWLARQAREQGKPGLRARVFLQAHWVILLVLGATLPVIVGKLAPAFVGWAIGLAGMAVLAVLLSVFCWRRGADALSLLPLVALIAFGVIVGYGQVAPSFNAIRSHHSFARKLDQLLPPDVRTVVFYHEIDEGLWFYLGDRAIQPVPGSSPRYNDSYDLFEDYGRAPSPAWSPAWRAEQLQRALFTWLDQPRRESDYLLVLGKTYDQLAPELAGRVSLVYRERGVDRNDLALLRVIPPTVAVVPGHSSR